MSRRPRNPGSDVWVLGIDPSLTRTAAVLIPPGWRLGDWSDLRWTSYGEKPPDRKVLSVLDYERARIERMSRIALHVSDFITREAGGDLLVGVRGFIEGYAHNKANEAHAASVREYGGILRHWLILRHSLPLHQVDESTARKQLLGKCPPRDRKAVTAQALYAAGAPFANDDECDAFTVAAWGLTEVGAMGFSLA